MERDVLDALDLRERHHEMQDMLSATDDHPGSLGSGVRLMAVHPGAAMQGGAGGAGTHRAGEAEDEAMDEDTWEFLTGNTRAHIIRSPLGGDAADAGADMATTSDSLLDRYVN